MKKYLLCLCSLMTALCIGCKDSILDQEQEQKEPLSVSPTLIEVDAQGGQKIINVKSGDAWDMNVNDLPSWVRTDIHAGQGNKPVTIKIEENTSAENRSTTLKVTEYSSKTTIPVSIIQKGVQYMLNVNPSAISLASDGKGQTVTIESNDDWTISKSESWLTIDKTSGSKNASFSVSASKYEEPTDRSGSITVKGTKSGISKTISVTQIGVGYSLSVDPTSISAGASEKTQKVTVKSNDSWTVTKNDPWISLSATKGSNDGSFTITISANSDTSERSGKVVVEGNNSGIKETITITQSGETYTLSVDKSSLSFSSKAESQSVTITSNDSWSITKSDSWISLDKTSGSSNGTFKVSVSDNNDAGSRSGSITVKGANSGTKIISVTQDGKSYNTSLDATSFSAGSSASSKTFTVTSNESWTVSKSDSWITLDKTSGSGNGTFKASVSANSDATSRSGSINVKGANSGKTITVTVTQSGVGFSLEVSPSSISASAAGESRNVTVTSNDSWTVTSNNSWISVSKSSGSGSSTFTAKISENTSTSSRSGSITVTGSNSGTKNITVTQDGKGYTLTVSPDNISTDYKGTTKNIQVKSNDSWTVSTSNGWFTVSKTKGSGDDSFTVTIGERTSTTTHEGTITVKGVNSGISRTINITQTGLDYNLSVSPTSFTAGADGITKSISVTSNDSWTVSKSDSWISLSKTSGSNDGSFSVTVSANSSTSSRSGSVTVKGSNSGKTITVTITQSGIDYNLSVNPTSISANSEGKSQTVTVTSNDSWNVTKTDSWISVSKSNGSNNGSFDATILPNTGSSNRSGSIIVKGINSGITRTINVSQNGVSYNLSVSPTSVSVGSGYDSKSFSISSNDSWNISISDSWISLNKTYGWNNDSFTASFSENTSTNERTGYIYIVGSNSGITASITIKQAGKTSSGHEYVDLGLQSGTKWATCNLGASKPEGYGDYYTWYETVGCDNIYNYYYYQTQDIAYKKWGNNWQTPTYDQIKELMEGCTWKAQSINGVWGVMGTSIFNGKTIFFPYSDVNGNNTHGTFWTISVFNNDKVGLMYIDKSNKDNEYIVERFKDIGIDRLNNKNCVRPVRNY